MTPPRARRLRWGVPAAPATIPLAALFAVPALLVAPDAAAHLVQTGFGPLVDSIVHAALGPDAVMTAAAAGFLCGMRPGEPQRVGRGLYLYGWALFFTAGAFCQYPFDFPLPIAVTLLGMGALVAADVALPATATLVVLGWAGSIYGIVGGGAVEGLPFSIGAPMGLLNIAILAATATAARALALRYPKARIAVRVAGSWIAAIGLLQLGWTLKYQSLP